MSTKYISKENLEYIWKNKLKSLLSEKQDNLNSAQLDAVNSGIDSNAVNKLKTIESNAQVNVQSDWNATSGDAFIKNKPTIGNGTLSFKIEGKEIASFKANQDSTCDVNITLKKLGLVNTLVYVGNFTTFPDASSYAIGSVITIGKKEYVNTNKLYWTEIGDESAYAYKTIKVKAEGALEGGGDLSSDITISHKNIGEAASLGLYKIGTDKFGHIEQHTAVTKKDVVALGIPAQDTNQTITAKGTTFTENAVVNLAATGDTNLTVDSSNIYINTKKYYRATVSTDGLMSYSDKAKLDNIEEGATHVLIDSSIATESQNAAQSGAVKEELDAKLNISASLTESEIDSICS